MTPDCDTPVVTHDEALRLLASSAGCTDQAIAALKRIARSTPDAWTDLSAAYSVRARRESRPIDSLDALDAADRAVKAKRDLPAARFNRALALEKLGLVDEAITAWDDFLAIDKSLQAASGRIHRQRLVRERATDAAGVWTGNSGALREAMREHDRAKIARLIAPFPSTAERFLYDLPLEWRATPTTERLAQMRLLAGEVERITGDRYDVDVVEALARRPRELWPGHRAYAEARKPAPNTHAGWFQNASGLLNGSPLQLLADLGTVPGIAWQKPAEAFALLDKLESEAQPSHYVSLLARIAAMRGHVQFFNSRYFDSLATYESALPLYAEVHDEEGVFASHVRKIGIYDFVGQKELAWAEAVAAMQSQSHVVETRSRHAFLGETATAAFALGHPAIALRYQDLAVQLTEGDSDTAQYSSALRGRAQIELELHQFAQATGDLQKAKELAGGKKDDRIRSALDAHILEVDGRAYLLNNEPAHAVEAFTKALAAARKSQAKTVVAELLAERAEAAVGEGDTTSAEEDLRTAFNVLRDEEKGNLEQRDAGVDEQVWIAYFSRFQRSYRLLIRQLVKDGRTAEAFEYAEKARAYDLLNLVHRTDLDAMKVPQLQALIPAGTYIIEYCVLDDRTYVWIVSRESLRFVDLSASREEIEHWSRTLQTAIHTRDDRAFRQGLHTPYDKLIAPFLLSIQKPANLVFVPDGAIHGLPIAALQSASSRRYVLQEGTVSIAASAKMYLHSLQRDESMPRDPAPAELLVGDPEIDPRILTSMKLGRLDGAKAEVQSIAAIYGPGAKVLTGADATLPAFLQLAPQKTIVHVAAHAIPNQNPSQLLLLLARSGDDSGALDAKQLWLKLKLDHTRLVVLSACSSAGGLPVGPGGVASLVRPLIGKGVPAVIGSIWEVGDATAAPLLVSFHRHYRQGIEAAEALRSAQLEMLHSRNPGLRSVLAWAPFQVIGHASSPFESPRRN